MQARNSGVRPLLIVAALALLALLSPNQAAALTPTPARTATPTPATGTGPDLVVTRMAITSRTAGCPQGPLGLLVTVANIGTATAGSFTVTANSSPAQTVTGLGAGASVSLWFSGYTYGSANTATADAAHQVAESNESNNTLSQMVPIPTPLYCPTATPTPTPGTVSRPDLVITSMQITAPIPGCPQGPLALRVIVTNTGAVAAGPFAVTANGSQTQTVNGLAAGANLALWFTNFTTIGNNTATADSNNQVAESNESNNTLSRWLPIPTPLYCPTATPTPTPGTVSRPDLVITSMQITAPIPGCPQGPLALRVIVTNTGAAAAGPFAVTANGSQTQTVNGLAAGANLALWFSNFTTIGNNTATADSNNQVAESNESNNTLSRWLPIPTPLSCPTVAPGTPTATPVPTP